MEQTKGECRMEKELLKEREGETAAAKGTPQAPEPLQDGETEAAAGGRLEMTREFARGLHRDIYG